jgi:small subunit ribosomal protein S6
MAKLVGKYETIFVIDTALTDEAIAELVTKFKTLVEQNATLGEVNEWGKRRLAYPISHKNEGYYVLITFESKPDFPAELTRIYNITDGVIRSIVVEQPE